MERGDGNRTRTISLGIRPIRASDRPDLGTQRTAGTAVDRTTPGLMARQWPVARPPRYWLEAGRPRNLRWSAFDVGQQIPHAFGRGRGHGLVATSIGGREAVLAGRSSRADTRVSHSCGINRPLAATTLFRTPGMTTAWPLSSARSPALMTGSGSPSRR